MTTWFAIWVYIVAAHPIAGAAPPAIAPTIRSAPVAVESGQPPLEIRRVSFSGIVQQASGEPVKGAKVDLKDYPVERLRWPGHAMRENDIVASTTTDDAGKFEFKDVRVEAMCEECHARLSLVVRVEGFGLIWVRAHASESDLGRLVVPPANVLRGRLLSESGKPAAGAVIRVTDLKRLDEKEGPFGDSLGLEFSTIVISAKADRDGKFEIGGLPPEQRVTMAIDHPELVRGRIWAATTDTPQDPIPSPPERYGIHGDDSIRVPVYTREFTAKIANGHVISGRVLDSITRQPLARVPVSIGQPMAFDKWDGRVDTRTDDAGNYRFVSVAPGPQTLDVRLSSKSPYISMSTHLDVTAPETKVDVVLERGIPLSGVVVDESTGLGVAGVHAHYNAYLGNSAGRQLDYRCHDSVTDAQGQFQLLVPAGKGSVTVFGNVPGYRIARDWLSHSPRFHRELTVARGSRLDPLQFRIGPTDSISGRITDPDGAPLSGVIVMEYGWDARRGGDDQPGIATTDASGAYELKGVTDEPVRFLLAIHEERKLKSVVRVPKLASQEEKARKIAFDFAIQPAAMLKAQLIVDGKPVKPEQLQIMFGESVPVVRDSEEASDSEVSTGSRTIRDEFWHDPNARGKTKRIPLPAKEEVDDEGTLTVGWLAPDWRYNLNCSIEGCQELKMWEFQLKPGEVRDLGRVELARLRDVLVTVVDEAGRPVEGVCVTIDPEAELSLPKQDPDAPFTIPVIEGRAYIVSPESDRDGMIRLTDVPRVPNVVQVTSMKGPRAGLELHLNPRPAFRLAPAEDTLKIDLKDARQVGAKGTK